MKVPAAIAVALLVAGGYLAMMHVKNDVQKLRQQQATLLEQQRNLKESLRVTRAEQAFLTRPEQLQAFAADLHLLPVQSAQVLGVGHRAFRNVNFQLDGR